MPDLWFYGILIFFTKGSNLRKIRAIVLKIPTNISYWSRNFGIEFGQNPVKRSNFSRFGIFWEFSQNGPTQADFDLSSWNSARKCSNTEWCLILNFVKISRVLQILDEFEFFYFFLSWYQVLKIRCIHESSSMRKPNQATYFLKETTLRNRWGSNMGIPIHVLFCFLTEEAGCSWNNNRILVSKYSPDGKISLDFCWNFFWVCPHFFRVFRETVE